MHAINTEFGSHETMKIKYFPRKISGHSVKCREKRLLLKFSLFPSTLGAGSQSLSAVPEDLVQGGTVWGKAGGEPSLASRAPLWPLPAQISQALCPDTAGPLPVLGRAWTLHFPHQSDSRYLKITQISLNQPFVHKSGNKFPRCFFLFPCSKYTFKVMRFVR